MARIPEDEVERLKREVSVQRLAEARGIKLHRHGADLLGLCPFHDDRNPSLVITPAKNLWHCLGACNEGGTVIDWVMKANGISFRHAVELLREDHLPLAAAPIQPVKHGTVRKLPPPVARDADDRELLLQVVSYYSETLKQSPEAMRYLESRGLQSAAQSAALPSCNLCAMSRTVRRASVVQSVRNAAHNPQRCRRAICVQCRAQPAAQYSPSRRTIGCRCNLPPAPRSRNRF